MALRIILARHFGKDVGCGLDDIGAVRLGRGDDLRGKWMHAAGARISDDLRQPPAVPRLGEDPQPFGQEQPLALARLLVA